MSKETILEEFDKEFVDRISGDMWQTTSREKIKQFISKAIDQTREETIKEVENILPRESKYLDNSVDIGWNDCLEQIKLSLNNLKQ